jgi:hypothetical protein
MKVVCYTLNIYNTLYNEIPIFFLLDEYIIYENENYFIRNIFGN